jgi:xanthine dehydrogenase/oxidase
LVREKPNLVYGGIRGDFVHATKTEEYLVGKHLNKMETLKGATDVLAQEVDPSFEHVTASPKFRKHLTLALLYKVS